MGLLSLLFSFHGRINRLQFWLGSLGVAFVVIAVTVMTLVSMAASTGPIDKSGAGLAPFLAVIATGALTIAPVWLVGAWCNLALQTKRFHDRGRSGYWTLLPLLPAGMSVSTLMGSIATGAPLEAFAVSGPVLLSWAINLWFFIDLGCLPGTSGPNRFGDPPGAPRSNAPATSGSPVPRPGASIPGLAKAPATAPAVNSLGNAEQAIARAIAQQSAPAPAARPANANATAATPSGFGRRATR
jgi:uncharacterized membrane protein YhaH (DUF805 family)